MADAFAGMSLTGSAAGMCADRADATFEERQAWPTKAKRGASPKTPGSLPAVSRLPEPQACDAIPEGVSRRCGMKGQHATAAECIEALRDRLAEVSGR